MALVKNVSIFNAKTSLQVRRLLGLVATFTSLLFASYAYAQQAIPSLNARIVDKTATLTSSQIKTLDQVLKDFEERKGSQIVVLSACLVHLHSITCMTDLARSLYESGRFSKSYARPRAFF